MQLFQVSTSTAAIYESVNGFNAIYESLKAFLESDQRSCRISSDFSEPSILNKKQLKAIEFIKGSGPVLASSDADGTLRVSGAPENLADYVDHFEFDRDASVGDHNHPDYFSKKGYIQTRHCVPRH